MDRREPEQLLDDEAGPLVRPYLASRGRTTPTVELDLITLIWSTGRPPSTEVEPEHTTILHLCREPISVAELSGFTKLPAMVVKVLVSDLLDRGAVTALSPEHSANDVPVLEALLNGLQRRL